MKHNCIAVYSFQETVFQCTPFKKAFQRRIRMNDRFHIQTELHGSSSAVPRESDVNPNFNSDHRFVLSRLDTHGHRLVAEVAIPHAAAVLRQAGSEAGPGQVALAEAPMAHDFRVIVVPAAEPPLDDYGLHKNRYKIF